MKKLTLKFKFLSILAVSVLMFGFLPVSPVAASSTSISIEDFKLAVQSSDPTKLVGVYVKEIMAVRVVQQSSASYVSKITNTVTQFGLANQYGTIGLLAHNYLSGRSFSELRPGTKIILVYGDGSSKEYTVTATKQYQALDPQDPYSNFVNMDDPDSLLSSTDLFKEMYTTSGNLVFQTCINKDGDPSWGRLFIIASPAA